MDLRSVDLPQPEGLQIYILERLKIAVIQIQILYTNLRHFLYLFNPGRSQIQFYYVPFHSFFTFMLS